MTSGIPRKKMIKVIKPEEKLFADKLIETGSVKKAALIAYPDTKYPQAKGQNEMQKDVVRDYIQQNAMPAIKRIVKLSELSRNEMVRLAANKDILDRAGYKPQENPNTIVVPLILPSEVIEKYSLNQHPDNEPQQ